MSEADIEDALDKIGYSGDRLVAMKKYLMEFSRRKSVFCGKTITTEDIATASLIFDGFNKIMEKLGG